MYYCYIPSSKPENRARQYVRILGTTIQQIEWDCQSHVEIEKKKISPIALKNIIKKTIL